MTTVMRIRKASNKPSLLVMVVLIQAVALLAFLSFRSSPMSRTEMPKEESETRHQFVHDNPNHVWHWTREHPPCPILGQKVDCNGEKYSDLYEQFHEEGWTIFTSCSLQKNSKSILDPIEKFLKTTDSPRVVSANMKEVKDLAMDLDTIEFIEYIHGGRRTFPYQTLNFFNGTEQAIHSDLIHFDTIPRTLMTAAWVPFEDMNENNGPLKFYPKSHKYGTWDYDEIGLHDQHQTFVDPTMDQAVYGKELVKKAEEVGLKAKYASEIKRGQTFLWAAALLHGGSKRKDESLSRMSQVTHYFFEGAVQYWQPRSSKTLTNEISYGLMNPTLTPCVHQVIDELKQTQSCADKGIEKFKKFSIDEPFPK